MELPVNVHVKMKAFFGSDGVTHRVPDDNIWVDTNCLEWKLPSFDLEIPKLDESLADALEEISRQISGKDLYTKAGYFNEKKYASRLKETFEQQASPELQDKLQALRPKLLEFGKEQENWHRTRKNTLKKARKLLQHDPVIAYWLETEWEISILETIVVAPITDQFEVLQLEQTDGGNYGISNEDIVSRLKLLDKEYGIDIVGANSSGLDFVLKRIPKGMEARELGKMLLEFCPDLYKAPRSFPKGKVSLWWD